jgi:hypothetical protein
MNRIQLILSRVKSVNVQHYIILPNVGQKVMRNSLSTRTQNKNGGYRNNYVVKLSQ